ncbi:MULTISPECIES: hypothetical protein [Flavobacteriaceae]|uniref:DUF4382 domain-containing protein n=2 Tax=Flavobacteriaceae TaxID=49546 RepID=A0A2V4XFS9_9FLAO|nr:MULTISPECIES: hypothetical protein [Flavobacteriaceae]MDX1278488.1 hypothetical protein [Oceanihabitans sediminis]MDX1773530.1 hypothetical protein [Oceanihabitans sediminis]PYE81915.1 hypothetical protein DFQ11_102494 [Winogradskyella epiphytica]GGW61848.1 hypothetical protein GCM10008085_11790 [Winogradskyella epiphytica]
MKSLKYFAIALFALVMTACTSDDSSDANSYENNITIEASTYPMNSALVETSFNSVFLSLTNITEGQIEDSFTGATINNVDLFSLQINDSDFTPNRTYDFSEITSLEFIVNGSIVNGEYEEGFFQFYKSGSNSNLEITDGSLTIIDYDVDNILLTFTFTRADGEAITGAYEGAFIYINNTDLD